MPILLAMEKRPTGHSGNVLDAPGETWMAVDRARATGRRRLRGGSSLAKLHEKM